ncbi:MAG: hypothetical protein R2769_16730 [Saprospiraceae bacterium]
MTQGYHQPAGDRRFPLAQPCEHFKLEFLAMDVTSEMQQRAMKNLANETLERMRNDVA